MFSYTTSSHVICSTGDDKARNLAGEVGGTLPTY